jgi:anti-sigma factor RsiW
VTCREIADFLMSYVDGELPATLQKVFESHLAECPECVAYLESYRTTVRLARNASPKAAESAPPELIRSILQAKRQMEGPGK